jgi:Tol biopolymer transport system component
MVRSLRLCLALGSAMALAVVTAAASAPNTTLTTVGEIAFAVHHGDGDAPWDIYVIRTNGRWVFKKATKGLQEDEPVWSPDGRHLAFQGWTIPGGADISIYTMNPDGTHRHRLARGYQPQWSPDGRRIAYTDNGIYVMNADGTDKKRVVRGDAADPHWSADGKQIAFTRKPGIAGSDVYIVNARGNAERRLTRTGDSDIAMWAPGRKIVFLNAGISIINVDGTGRRTIRR